MSTSNSNIFILLLFDIISEPKTAKYTLILYLGVEHEMLASKGVLAAVYVYEKSNSKISASHI